MNALAVKLSSYSPVALTLLRVAFAVLFMQHGAQKLFDYPPGGQLAGNLQMKIGGYIEFYGGGMLLLGLLTRPTAFILAGTMAVAYVQFHLMKALKAEPPISGAWWPAVNKGELALLYFFVFFYLIFAGGGAYSVDRVLFGRRTDADFKK